MMTHKRAFRSAEASSTKGESMNGHNTTPARLRRASGPLGGLFILTLFLALAACDSLLEVQIPGQVEEGELNDPSLATTMVVSAVGEFECAFSSYVATTAVLTEEFIVSTFFLNANIWGWRGDVEIRGTAGSCPNSRSASGLGYYTPLQTARFLADDGAERIRGFADADVPNRAEKLAELSAYAGYAYTLLGEGFCEMAIDNGPLLTPSEVLQIAEDRFSQAIQLAQEAGSQEFRNMALVGRARVRLNLGRPAEAATDAEQVPEGFVKYVEHSEVRPRRENRLYNLTDAAFMSVGPDYRDLEVVPGSPDPRVPVAFSGTEGQDGVTPQWNQLKYGARGAPAPLASWTEAQMILAEARGGGEGIDALNRVRTAQGIPQIDPAEVSDFTSVLLEERRRQLFLQGHRYNDMLRHDIPFPTGTNHKGQSYGNVTCVPLPDVERLNNPNIGS